ncbi:PAS domain S-box-containing protein [Pedobacter sp. W3I1]|uniref:hybrid sensor histidine kinase/response regulator n=1 Tax=Pedobacter sp. W3I1 TaxID=3042291 RepID=UPI002780E070|nr:ATP-binding protein [Pedobacter sp. W3I1]MDQ0639941.1 PAS domain S-box-containing protein [Pedobacter sp. W3I1]
MAAPLKILIVEDNKSDADLICREIKRSGISFHVEIIHTRPAFEHALLVFNPDLILSDFSLPAFDAVTAFRIKQREYADIPFIIISGVIGEENAVELIKEGVTDYVSKEKLFTLPVKIKRALQDSLERKDKLLTSEKLRIQTQELLISNGLLIAEREKVESVNLKLFQLNRDLELRVEKRTKALAESEHQFRSMMETIPQIAWTNSPEGKVIYFNSRWSDYTGLSEKSKGALRVNNLIHKADLKVSLGLYNLILEGNAGGEFQSRILRSDGEYRWHLVRLMPILNETEKIVMWIGTATDIHELRLLQQQKDDFISIASHELKTPITALKLSLQILDKIKNEPSSPRFPMLIAQANKGLEKVNALIEDLLNTGMAKDGQLQINQKRCSLAECIDDSCNNLINDLVYSVDVQGDTTIEVYADTVRISQVVTNFINNAIKYASKSSKIKILIERQSDVVRLSVIDKGPGIRPENLSYLFDRYYKVDSTGGTHSGLGLGLYICEEIIKKHGGQIGVDSEPGVGTAFWFTLPVFENKQEFTDSLPDRASVHAQAMLTPNDLQLRSKG